MILQNKPMTQTELEDLSDKLGITASVKEMHALVEDEQWVYAELARADEEWFRSLPPDAVIELTPTGLFNATGEIEHLKPLLAEIDAGTADEKKRQWLTGAVRRERFKSKKRGVRKRVTKEGEERKFRGGSIWERADAMGALVWAAEVEVPEIARLLRERGLRVGVVARAMKIAAIHHDMPLRKIEQYRKHGRFDRHRLADA